MSNYNWSVENAKIDGFRYSDKYKNGSGYLIFQDRSGEHKLRFIIYDKKLVDLIFANQEGKFLAKGDLEHQTFKDKPEPYSVRVLQRLELISLPDSEDNDDEIPF